MKNKYINIYICIFLWSLGIFLGTQAGTYKFINQSSIVQIRVMPHFSYRMSYLPVSYRMSYLPARKVRYHYRQVECPEPSKDFVLEPKSTKSINAEKKCKLDKLDFNFVGGSGGILPQFRTAGATFYPKENEFHFLAE